jgi:hypothetical protein
MQNLMGLLVGVCKCRIVVIVGSFIYQHQCRLVWSVGLWDVCMEPMQIISMDDVGWLVVYIANVVTLEKLTIGRHQVATIDRFAVASINERISTITGQSGPLSYGTALVRHYSHGAWSRCDDIGQTAT